MAPEVTLGKQDYGSPCDVFSFGIILSELLTRQAPYSDLDKSFQQQTHIKVALDVKLRPTIPEDLPVNITEEEFGLSELISQQQIKLIQLMCSCWDAEPQNRPAFEDGVVTMLAELHKEILEASNSSLK